MSTSHASWQVQGTVADIARAAMQGRAQQSAYSEPREVDNIQHDATDQILP
jgi:hypothetical protein